MTRRWTKNDLLAVLPRFERNLRAGGTPGLIADASVAAASAFIASLPDDVEASTESALRLPGRKSCRAALQDGDGPPDALRVAVQEWRDDGSPAQKSVAWKQPFWTEVFGAQSPLLDGLPAMLGRKELCDIGTAAVSGPAGALRAIAAVLVWGYDNSPGRGQRNARKLLDDPVRTERVLHRAAVLIRDSGPREAFRFLTTDREGKLPGLGTSFASKFIHFCQPEDQLPRAFIVDDIVRSWFRTDAEIVSSTTDAGYACCLELVRRWSERLGTTPEELELCVFRLATRRRNNRWGSK